MVIGLNEIVTTVVSSLVTSIFVYIILKIMKENRSFFRVFGVILISDIAMIFLPYLSVFLPLSGYIYLGISLLLSLLIYKYGLNLSWLRTIILVILTPIIALIIGMILGLIGLGAIIGMSSLQ